MRPVTMLLLYALIITGTSFSPVIRPESSVQWMTIEEALAAQKKKPRKIFIDVYTDWCGWCKKMDASTFQHPEVVKLLNENFYAVKFDAESRQTYTYLGKQFDFVAQGNRGYNQLAHEWLNGRLSYPTTVYLNEEGRTIFPVPGYIDAATMETILHYVKSDSYQKMTWDDYQRSFTGAVK